MLPNRFMNPECVQNPADFVTAIFPQHLVYCIYFEIDPLEISIVVMLQQEKNSICCIYLEIVMLHTSGLRDVARVESS